MFTNMILSYVLSAVVTNSPLTGLEYHTPKAETSFFKYNSQILLVNSVGLIYTDIFQCTKPYYLPHYQNNILVHCPEVNPIANFFFKNNLWNISFISTTVLNYAMVSIFNNNILSYMYIVSINIAEICAINYCKSNNNSIHNIQIKIPLYVLNF